jgi:hypothetical protein
LLAHTDTDSGCTPARPAACVLHARNGRVRKSVAAQLQRG